MSIQTAKADPLYAQPRAERPAYATGMLLDAQDFSDEQTYHRGRLARALAYLAGGGTLAGLEVKHLPTSPTQVEEISVAPGLAVDRLGRLIEIPRPACLRLERWFESLAAIDGGDQLLQAARGNLAGLVSQRMTDSATPLPARAVIADVFIRFAACAVGLTPSFAAGPFDALNAVSTSRLRDAYELVPVARTDLSDVRNGLPLPPADDPIVGDPNGDAILRRNAMQDAVLEGYGEGGEPKPGPEHPPGLDASSVFLARVLIPVGLADPPVRTAELPIVDNGARRFLPPVSLFAQWAGL